MIGELVMEGVSRLVANYSIYDIMTFPFSGLLVEDHGGQKYLDSPEIPTFRKRIVDGWRSYGLFDNKAMLFLYGRNSVQDQYDIYINQKQNKR